MTISFSPFVRQCFVTASVGINIIGHGCSMAIPAVLLPQLHQPDSHIKIGKDDDSWITSVSGIALLMGNFITPPIMGRYGRRIAHMAVTLPIIIGWILMILAPNVQVLVVGRMLQGISFGMLLPLRSPLIGEYTSPRNRGAFLTTISFSQAFGILFVHLMGSVVSWQKAALICMFFSFISLILIIYSPESPSWLLTKGRYDECRTVFRWLRGSTEEEELEAMIRARILYLKEEQIRKAAVKNRYQNFKEILVKKEVYKPVILMLHIYFMAEFAGGVILANHSVTIIALLLGPNANPHFWMVFIDTQRILSNALAILVIRKFSRRSILFSFGLLNVVSYLGMSAHVYCKSNGIYTSDILWLPIVLLNLQVLSIAVGIVPMTSVIPGEVFPLEYRSTGNTISLVAISLFYFIVTQTFPDLLLTIGLDGTFLIYAIVLIYNLSVSWFMMPETKGKTLQEIEDIFRGRSLLAEEIAMKENSNKELEEENQKSDLERRCSNADMT